MEEKTHPPSDLPIQINAVGQLDRVKCELREALEHERGRRLGFLGNVNLLSSYREKDRAEYAFSQLVNEREQRSLRVKLIEALQDVSRLRGEIFDLQTRAESQHRELKYLLEMLERKGFIHREEPRARSTA